MADQQGHTSAVCGHRMLTREPARSDGQEEWMVKECQGILFYHYDDDENTSTAKSIKSEIL